MKPLDITCAILCKRFSAGWLDKDGYRYHVWFDPKTFVIDPHSYAGGGRYRPKPALYKNAPKGEKGTTIILDPSAKSHAPTVAAVFDHIKRQGLIALAEKTAEDEAEAQRQENLEAYRIQKMQQAGPVLYAAIKNFFAKGTNVLSVKQLRDAMDAAEVQP